MKSSKIQIDQSIHLEYQSIENMPSLPGNWIIKDGEKTLGYVEETGVISRNHARDPIDRYMVDTFIKAIKIEGVHILK
jgi:hypothetical protein